MKIASPLSYPQLAAEVSVAGLVAVAAFVWVLPRVEVWPYGHVFFLGWLGWRSRCLSRHVLTQLAWTTQWEATPLPHHPSPQGVVMGDGFLWTGEHVSSLHTYVERFQTLPIDSGERGGSPAIHGCGRPADRRVTIPFARLNSHVALEGSTRCGKTNLLAGGVDQIIATGDGAVVIIDPKGSDALYEAARSAAVRYSRAFALIRPRTPELSASFNVISSCEETTDLPGRLRPIFPEGREAFYKDEPLTLLQRVAGMHKALDIPWDIRHLHRDVMNLDALQLTLAKYVQVMGGGIRGMQADRVPPLDLIKERYAALGIDDPIVPGCLRMLERTQRDHQDRCGNLDVALSGVVDVKHAAKFGAQDSLTWDEIDHRNMVVVFRTDSLITQQIGRNIASLFFQDFMGYMGLRYLRRGSRRTPITIFVDEVGEIVYPDFRHAINKIGEAGGRLFLAWQTEADLDAALGKYQANVIRANCQTRITMRIADPDTADLLARQSPKVRVRRVVSNRATASGRHSGKGISVEDEEVSLIDPNLLHAMPVGQCFVRLDGALFHVNIPYQRKAEPCNHVPPDGADVGLDTPSSSSCMGAVAGRGPARPRKTPCRVSNSLPRKPSNGSSTGCA
jgi:hypothetical protein